MQEHKKKLQCRNPDAIGKDFTFADFEKHEEECFQEIEGFPETEEKKDGKNGGKKEELPTSVGGKALKKIKRYARFAKRKTASFVQHSLVLSISFHC